MLDMGIARAPVVQSFIGRRVEIDFEYPEKLKAGFLTQYYGYFRQGLRGDDLFEALRAFSTGGSTRFERAAAGLAVLCYLFQACEVFKKDDTPE